MDRIKNKVALITGASQGIGEGIARLFVAEGAHVVLTDIHHERGESLARELGERAHYIPLDVTEESQWENVIKDIQNRLGGLDILVNNAAIFLMQPIEKSTSAEWDRTFDVNAKSVFLGCKHAALAMRKVGGGSIVNISSVFGLVGGPSLGVFAASKGAVRLFTKAATAEYAKDNIRVNSIHPGLIETPLTAEIISDPQRRDVFLSKTLMGRPGQPLEVAKAVLFLANEDSSYMTGAELVIDGGLTAI